MAGYRNQQDKMASDISVQGDPVLEATPAQMVTDEVIPSRDTNTSRAIQRCAANLPSRTASMTWAAEDAGVGLINESAQVTVAKPLQQGPVERRAIRPSPVVATDCVRPQMCAHVLVRRQRTRRCSGALRVAREVLYEATARRVIIRVAIGNHRSLTSAIRPRLSRKPLADVCKPYARVRMGPPRL
jgi:hypothetical protein